MLAWVSDRAEVVRVVIYDDGAGAYLFPYASAQDGNASGDSWFESLDDAKSAANKLYGVVEADWIDVGDPLAGCQHDWLTPARVPGRDEGAPRWGHLEVLCEGVWRLVVAGESACSLMTLWPPPPKPTRLPARVDR